MAVPLFASAQADFRAGYIVPLSGDTLRGQVDARGAQRNARMVRFRPSPEAAATEYRPRQIRGYGFTGGQIYQAAVVALTDSAQLSNLTEARYDTVARPSFLEVIVRGPASLLFLRDERSNDHFYLQMADGQPKELVRRMVMEKNNTVQRSLDEYKYTLAAGFRSCPSVQPSINTVRFDQAGLIRIVKRYNECTGGPSVMPAATSRQNHVQLALVAGGEYSRLIMNDERVGYSTTTTVNLAGSIQPAFGIALQLRLVGLNKNLSTRIEALYEKQKYALFTTSPNASGNYSQYRGNMSSIRVPLLLRYTYPKGLLRPFAQVGYSFSYLLTVNNEMRNIYPNTTFILDDSKWHPVIPATRTLEQGIIGGIGLSTARTGKRNISLEARYERSDGFNDGVGFGSRVNRTYVLLSYDLTK
ncbi:porin family protein [Hymenobacter pini]|uniref:porin family protein n=1 Tax=Hymenobacter pini TaxID=2880879 RepID=UPI001CF16A64|nr:porin family protein [Hymenobacter pini]MCA8831362.1 PorT family protein [Hymenobacter pini]